MTDSIQIFPPGFRVEDASGNPVSGAVVQFFVADTTTPLTVYADDGLTTNLGTSVTCDSGGYPSSAGVRVLIYTGTAAYKVVCLDASAVELWSHAHVRGAVDTSAFITTAGTSITYAVTPVTTTGTWVKADIEGRVFEANPSGGNFTRTMPTAASCFAAGRGIPFKVTNIGFGIVTLLTQGSEVFNTVGTDSARKAILLTQRGDSVELVSDGVNWTAFFNRAQTNVLTFAVEDLRTAPAGTPVVGGFYLLNGAPTGAFTSTTPACAANDIVMYDGQVNYQIFRPYSDCGWLAFDKSTNTLYRYQNVTWVAENDLITYASQAELEAGTVANKPVTPLTMKFHQGVAKAGGSFVAASGALNAGTAYNVSSVTRAGAGSYSVNFTSPMATANYMPMVCSDVSGAYLYAGHRTQSKSTTSFTIITIGVVAGGGTTVADMNNVDFVVHGDMP